jgi:hypothetical protein
MEPNQILQLLEAIQREQREQRRGTDDLIGAVTRLASAIEQEDRLRDSVARTERWTERQRDQKLDDSLERVETRIENVGSGLRDLPEAIRRVERIEKKINELIAHREARTDAVGAEDSPLALPTQLALPPRREPTGQIKVPPLEESEKDDGLALTPHQQKKLATLVVGGLSAGWRWAKWVLLPAAGALLKDAISWLRGAGH